MICQASIQNNDQKASAIYANKKMIAMTGISQRTSS
jgi:hypothetical protein